MNELDPLLGIVIDGRYRIDARIARGGMASVYRAVNVRLHKPVAVKLIHPHLAEQEDFTEKFIREARSAAALSCPHIVTVYDQGIVHTPQGDRAYLVMDLVEGPDLRSELSAHGSFTLRDSLELTRQVLAALATAHGHGIIHRDVKPENILLSTSIAQEPQLDSNGISLPPSYVAKVADFGLARAMSDATSSHSGQMLGTVAYVPPEVVLRGSSSASADIYSTGIMLYELIAGIHPFTGESPVAVAYAHVNEDMPRLADKAEWIPPAIDSLIAAFTAKDPAQRPADGSAALQLLLDVISSLPPELGIRRIPVFPRRPRVAQTRLVGDGTEGAAQPAETFLADTSTSSLPNSTLPSGATVLPASKIPLPVTAELPDALSDNAENIAADVSAVNNAFSTAVSSPAPSKKKKSKKPLWVTVILLFILTALGAGGYWWRTAGPGLRVDIPQVAGMSADEAHKALAQAGFTNVRDAHEFSDSVEAHHVIGTDPAGGGSMHPSHTLTLTISDGIEYLTVPNVIGEGRETAEQTLIDARFVPSISEDWSQDVPEGIVISQTPSADESVPHDSEVIIVVSKGKEPLTVPDVGDVNGDDYAKLLEETGFSVQRSDEFSDTIAEGKIISVTPEAGSDLFRGDTVTIVVSKGPELIEVPSVVSKQQDQAVTILENAGFTVNVEKVLGGYFGTVRLQDPEAGTMARKGSTITITVV